VGTSPTYLHADVVAGEVPTQLALTIL